MKKRILAIVLSMVLCFSCAIPAFAAVDETEAESEVTSAAEETTQEEETTQAEITTEAAEDSGFSFDISIEDILNSEIVLGILGSDGFMELLAVVTELMATFDQENIENMAKDEIQNMVQVAFDTIAGMIADGYNSRDILIRYAPLQILKNLLGLDDDVFPTKPDENTKKDPNELEIGPGDVDGDGRVTAADARLILRRAAQLITFTMEQDALADVDKDGKVTARDARLVLRYAAGLFTEDDYAGTSFEFHGTIG